MKTIKKTGQKGRMFINRYENSNNYQLSDCYTTYSNKKYIAWLRCVNIMEFEKGFGIKILSYNTFEFTVGWKTEAGDYRIETAYNSYYIID